MESLLLSIISFFSYLISVIVSLVKMVITALSLCLYLIVTIIPLGIKLFDLVTQLIPTKIVGFAVISLAIYFIKWIMSQGKGKGGSSGSNNATESKDSSSN